MKSKRDSRLSRLGARSPRIDALIRQGRAEFDRGDISSAEATLRPLVYGSASDPEALFLTGLVAERQRRPVVAASMATRSLDLLEHPDPLLLLARCKRLAGETDECLGLCDRALLMRPGWLPALAVRSGCLEEAGRYEEARQVLDSVQDRTEGGAFLPLEDTRAKLLIHDKQYDTAVAITDELLADHRTAGEFRRSVLYTRAKALDRGKRYAAAFASAQQANQIGELPFDPGLYVSQVDQLIENWSEQRIKTFPEAKCDSAVPVFVAGMPRSGTSLIDQIIDAHPAAAGVGELSSIEQFANELSSNYDPSLPSPKCFGRCGPHRWTRVARDYVRQIEELAGPDAQRVVNKALGNNKLVGLVSRLFPETRIIHAIRDPRDVAVSCFMGGFNNRLHPWTTRLEWAAVAWEQSMRMMEHWKAVLDVPILEVRYERLVSDPDTEFPRLIEFLGLKWDDRCAEFHRSRRTVRTLSYDQVNRPLYTTSAGRHANYEEQIRGIKFPEY